MFAGFNLSVKSSDVDRYALNGYIEIGKSLYSEQQEKVHEVLESFINPDGSLNATKIEENWFPQISADVFLSHSHDDEEIVIKIAGYLYEKFGIKCFIDSCVWDYGNKLLKRIDDVYCKTFKHPDGSYSYDYNKRNQSTSHIHLLLNGALAKMINATECLIFVNTPNSIKVKDTIEQIKTASPWIYSELLMATEFPHRKLADYRQESLQHFAQ